MNFTFLILFLVKSQKVSANYRLKLIETNSENLLITSILNAVFQRNSAGILEVNIWNHSGILMELHWNTIGILPLILSKFTTCFPEIFRWNTTHFLAERTGILMEFLWPFEGILVVFSRIWVVFWWNFSGTLMELQTKKQCEGSYLQNLIGIFAEFFIYFLILLYPYREWQKPSTVGA